ncbi:hypothetical protein BO78DRAFT_47945 [Aspergillus sclerotiicarbonarius CBS 121057]|uniref:Extracellular membrane protein CFEM domain-containing protein n=1 Tax=Aspergillus sclerotiicarbonarius (strain CBS 121057 / IBT 28362) TaxID=1448318 RepID=A0A319EFX8_ASPSB|nr:hypothetical protein BO78DRAFT_47945 [Aspergillus sclerotiicarbonarius CBS 121057]
MNLAHALSGHASRRVWLFSLLSTTYLVAAMPWSDWPHLFDSRASPECLDFPDCSCLDGTLSCTIEISMELYCAIEYGDANSTSCSLSYSSSSMVALTSTVPSRTVAPTASTHLTEQNTRVSTQLSPSAIPSVSSPTSLSSVQPSTSTTSETPSPTNSLPSASPTTSSGTLSCTQPRPTDALSVNDLIADITWNNTGGYPAFVNKLCGLVSTSVHYSYSPQPH